MSKVEEIRSLLDEAKKVGSGGVVTKGAPPPTRSQLAKDLSTTKRHLDKATQIAGKHADALTKAEQKLEASKKRAAKKTRDSKKTLAFKSNNPKVKASIGGPPKINLPSTTDSAKPTGRTKVKAAAALAGYSSAKNDVNAANELQAKKATEHPFNAHIGLTIKPGHMLSRIENLEDSQREHIGFHHNDYNKKINHRNAKAGDILKAGQDLVSELNKPKVVTNLGHHLSGHIQQAEGKKVQGVKNFVASLAKSPMFNKNSYHPAHSNLHRGVVGLAQRAIENHPGLSDKQKTNAVSHLHKTFGTSSPESKVEKSKRTNAGNALVSAENEAKNRANRKDHLGREQSNIFAHNEPDETLDIIESVLYGEKK